jgi:chromosome segregation ATPase
MKWSSYIRTGDNKGLACLKDGPMVRIHFFFWTIAFGRVDIEELIRNLLNESKAKSADNVSLENRHKELEEAIRQELETSVSQSERLKETLAKEKESYNKAFDKWQEERKELSKQLDSIEYSVADHEDLVDDHDDLQLEFEKLNERFEKIQFELEYTLKYFNLIE